ncbi:MULTISPECIES: 3-hydroxyacyl-CoA dehydrogenase NAD-binding domain-containing protein [Sinorhizobium]|uniref:3-hydroxyacyl-CoA dehydrogenase NAD-binding domain-containing protein n=1 Tax=Sinorhizobium TaxID=28105 RepID=UPI000BE7DA24|nr:MULTISPECIES: 3-hydroxyacyl-CoA dehydrogenase NAD-binding domain-containing protein [Sinorhizobium]PDT50924.1 3-hydroxyacyl-CoA dehydrogenase [Sinorhizobium sp. NG07B]POH25042.1 3-hydroxyacyl-CoA dehydrogenase [Sinorhizobium americanum]
MTNVVSVERKGAIAYVWIDSPPVNALSVSVRAGLNHAFASISRDADVRGVILACKGRTFIAGADITEFDKADLPPDINDVIRAIEDCGKPVVAAIHGTALGGGVEVALGCHYRVAVPDAKLGLPEVKLGLLPGGGGTQRLPRAVGPLVAVKMIVGGEPISAGEALSVGLIDEVVDDPVTGAEALLRKVIDEGRPLRKLRNDDSKLAACKADRSLFTKAVEDATKRVKAFEAPFEVARAIEAVLEVPFDEGLKRERAGFEKLVVGEQSKSQRYAFFAQRAANKIPAVAKETKPRDVRKVAVIGAGTMGGGIGMSFANQGLPVTLIELDRERLDKGLAVMKGNWEASAARGGIAKDAPAQRMALVTGATELEAIHDADLVIEAVFETMAVKKDVFSRLDKAAKPGAILASNTSFLDINEIAAVTQRPQDVLGMHFFSPANVMKLCEVVRGARTSPDALVTAVATARRIGKIPVVVGVCDGFVGNRMLMKRQRQAEMLLYEGVRPDIIDGVLTKFGIPMGPFAMEDMAGLDIAWRSRQERGETSEIADALCEAGRFGQKAAAGYYRYQEGSRTPLVDPDVGSLIDRTLKKLGRTPRQVGEDEILERLLYPMINEGARILEEGIAVRASDIDVIWLYGYGWPAYRGGPMHWADFIGLDKIADSLSRYAETLGQPDLRPSSLLKKLADTKSSFSALDAAKL